MKLQGEFVVRQVMDQIVAIPVGETALRLNGMILLNDVSRAIWENLETETSPEQILAAVTENFEVSEAEARADIEEFLDKLRKMQILEESL